MLLAIVLAIELAPRHLLTIFIAIAIGSLIGLVLARTVKMTAMPQMVALLNGFGGAASALVAAAEYSHLAPAEVTAEKGTAIQLGVLVGALTFSGSVVAYAKLEELLSGKPLTYPFQRFSNLGLLALALLLALFLVSAPEHVALFLIFNALSLALGVLFVLPIGGADMPVVISLLNSLSGVAASIAGFVIVNQGLIVSGALVGASGLILTRIMCKAMNRSLGNVIFGAFGGDAGGAAAAADAGERAIREVQAGDAAVMLAYARLVVVVPGYGLAVAQAQHVVRELAGLLEKRGVEVKYGIHPVAGRMPGHMNVLLAEADVPYDRLYDMDAINPELERADVAVVIGANDVVNPAARSDPGSPIYGMPIINVDKAASAIVLKRSMRPGFAGIDNALFYAPRTHMLFGDAKESLQRVIQEVKEL
jgi:NAD(P) transhydrogenase subunit beta